MIKSILIAGLLVFVLGTSANAEDQLPTLSERFDNCMNTTDCAPSERISLLVKVTTEMQKAAETMNQNCISKNYKSCIGPKSPGTLQWYRMYSYLAEIADSLEGSPMSERDLPALPPEDHKIEQQWPNWYQAQKTK